MKIETIMFDLDDTLLNRDNAIEKMFTIIINKFYLNQISDIKELNKMLTKFKLYDNKGYSRKTDVFKQLFSDFPPLINSNDETIISFWNTNFPNCFAIEDTTLELIAKLKKDYKLAIITNGATDVQKNKIFNTNLNNYFKDVFISDAVGFKKPQPEIFLLALKQLNTTAKQTLFIGDNLENDINGCQNLGIKGVWYNPSKIDNKTNIKPYSTISQLNDVLKYI